MRWPSPAGADARTRLAAAGRLVLRTSARAASIGGRQARDTLAEALELMLPRACPGCGGPEPWCAACASTLGRRPRQVTLPTATVDRFARSRLPVPTVYALARYSGAARAVILAGKERGRRDLPPLVGDTIGAAVATLQGFGSLPPALWLVPAPTKRAAARARGGDPVTAMARAAARLLASRGLPTGIAACLFTARRARDSVGLDAAARAANLRGSIRFDPRATPPPGADILLIDDVLTSGATVFESCDVLRSAGFAVPAALVVAAVPQLRPVLVPPNRPVRHSGAR